MVFHIAELCQAEGEDKSTPQKDRFVCFGLGFNQWPERKKLQQITPLLDLLFWKFGLNFTRFFSLCQQMPRLCQKLCFCFVLFCFMRETLTGVFVGSGFQNTAQTTRLKPPRNTQRHWKTLANTKQNTFRPSIINKFWHGQPASDDRRTLSRHHSTAPIIVLILLALQLPSGHFFLLFFF